MFLEFVVCVFEACEEIETLQSEMQRLKSLKMGLNQQRDAYITELSQRSGEGPGDEEEEDDSPDSVSSQQQVTFQSVHNIRT